MVRVRVCAGGYVCMCVCVCVCANGDSTFDCSLLGCSLGALCDGVHMQMNFERGVHKYLQWQ